MAIHCGDLFDVLPTLPADSIEACVTDPPYGLEFMGKEWDRLWDKRSERDYRSEGRTAPKYRSQQPTFIAGAQAQAFHERWAREVFRVLKPGAHLLAFGGTRTSHRMVCAIEDAGFEIRDSLCWLYGSGFPKSLNVSKAIDEAAGAERNVVGANPSYRKDQVFAPSFTLQRNPLLTAPATDAAKQWDGWGTALKPAFEPIVLARKPLRGTVVANVLAHGTGALNIDACRIGIAEELPHYTPSKSGLGKHGIYGASSREQGANSPTRYDVAGRWPSNVLLDESAAKLLDAQSGESVSGGRNHSNGDSVSGNWRANEGRTDPHVRRNDYAMDASVGGASRFFYVAKPSREERDYGCWDLEQKTAAELTGRKPGSAGLQNPRAGIRAGSMDRDIAARVARNSHPTVKPVELIRYLVKLIVPPNGTCLDPFMGSGTTGMACRYELRPFIGIEQDPAYVAIAERRIADCAPLFAEMVG